MARKGLGEQCDILTPCAGAMSRDGPAAATLRLLLSEYAKPVAAEVRVRLADIGIEVMPETFDQPPRRPATAQANESTSIRERCVRLDVDFADSSQMGRHVRFGQEAKNPLQQLYLLRMEGPSGYSTRRSAPTGEAYCSVPR
jgi:hypothetical protein